MKSNKAGGPMETSFNQIHLTQPPCLWDYQNTARVARCPLVLTL